MFNGELSPHCGINLTQSMVIQKFEANLLYKYVTI